jgi:hypothetical protein
MEAMTPVAEAKTLAKLINGFGILPVSFSSIIDLTFTTEQRTILIGIGSKTKQNWKQ